MAKRQSRGQQRALPGRLRIVAGNWRGRRLPIIEAEGLRPTSERVRETLFNWLMYSVQGTRCLDLFAGTGALGIEALSRGAAHCTFVELNKSVAALLRDNLDTLRADNARVITGDALNTVSGLQGASFDLVFLDPPFQLANVADVCHHVNESGILAKGARVYIEEDRNAAPLELPAGWTTEKTGHAGNVRYSLVAIDD